MIGRPEPPGAAPPLQPANSQQQNNAVDPQAAETQRKLEHLRKREAALQEVIGKLGQPEEEFAKLHKVDLETQLQQVRADIVDLKSPKEQV